MREKHIAMINTSKVTLGRWIYCKYCYKNVKPRLGGDYSIVLCSECGYGLACTPGLHRVAKRNVLAAILSVARAIPGLVCDLQKAALRLHNESILWAQWPWPRKYARNLVKRVMRAIGLLTLFSARHPNVRDLDCDRRLTLQRQHLCQCLHPLQR
jgi:hypothetical protein